MSEKGCPHGPGIAALCRECALENKAGEELLDEIEIKSKELEAKIASLPPHLLKAMREGAEETLVEKISELDAAARADVATVAAETSCTICQKDALVSRHRNANTVPAGWFVIDEVGDTGGVFCSTACVDAYRDAEEARR
jgi:hypothetical protein